MEEATSSPTPKEIMANTVPARLEEKLPMMAPKTMPANPPMMGTKGNGMGQPLAATAFMKWMQK